VLNVTAVNPGSPDQIVAYCNRTSIKDCLDALKSLSVYSGTILLQEWRDATKEPDARFGPKLMTACRYYVSNMGLSEYVDVVNA